jgi:hypothetical protein
MGEGSISLEEGKAREVITVRYVTYALYDFSNKDGYFLLISMKKIDLL